MGKGRPGPRETAKEKKSPPRKPVAAKTSSSRTGAATPESKRPPSPKAGKAEPEKAPDLTAGGRPAKTEKTVAQGSSPAKTTMASPPKKEAGEAPVHRAAERDVPAQKRSVEKPAAEEPASPTQSEPGPPVQPEAQSGGEPDELDGVKLPAAGGKVGVFGGPKDRSVKPDDRLGLPTGRHYQYEQFRGLNPKGYYCAMRWEYRQQHMSAEEGKRWWANKKIAVTNPANNKSVIVRAVDYGPHETSGLAIAISPGAAEAIGVEAGQEVLVAFADEKLQLGPASAAPAANL